MSHHAVLTPADLDSIRTTLANESATLRGAFTTEELQGMADEAVEGCAPGCSTEQLHAAVIRTALRIASELDLGAAESAARPSA